MMDSELRVRAEPPPPETSSTDSTLEAAYVQLTDMSFSFAGSPDKRVLSSIRLGIDRGTFVSFVGPSGCGKTTLLRLVAGILSPTEGQIVIDGRAPTDPQRHYRTGFVFQHPVLLDWRSARENVELPSEILGGRAPVVHAQRMLDLVGLTGYEDHRPFELSGGMRSRLSLAQALGYAPELLLLDEPFSTLDEASRELVCSEVLKIFEDRRPTVLLVTHRVDEAVLLSDWVHVLTPRPARLHRSIKVDMPRPRTVAAFDTAAYADCVRAVRIAVREAGIEAERT